MWGVGCGIGLAGLGLGCAGQVRPPLPVVALAPTWVDTTARVNALPQSPDGAQSICPTDPVLSSGPQVRASGSIAGKTATVHWPDRRDNNPIRVWIQSAPNLAEWNADDRMLVAKAFHAWDKADLPVRFFFINSNAGADIVVRWIDKFSNQHEGWTTMWWDRQGWIQNGDMVLALHTPTGRTLTPTELKALATHEAGHALGLAHSPDRTAVMAPTIYAADVTSVDVMAAQRLYAQIPGRNAMLAQAGGQSAAKLGEK